jgi:hypothetical protein
MKNQINLWEPFSESSHSEIWNGLLSCLRSLLVKHVKYTFILQNTKATVTYLDQKKALIKDISKYIKRNDNKMPITYVFYFEEFEWYLIIEDVQNYVLLPDGVCIFFKDYEVELCKT